MKLLPCTCVLLTREPTFGAMHSWNGYETLKALCVLVLLSWTVSQDDNLREQDDEHLSLLLSVDLYWLFGHVPRMTEAQEIWAKEQAVVGEKKATAYSTAQLEAVERLNNLDQMEKLLDACRTLRRCGKLNFPSASTEVYTAFFKAPAVITQGFWGPKGMREKIPCQAL